MERQTVHLFVFDTLADWEHGYATAGINNPAFSAGPQRYGLKTVGLSRQPVVTMGGLTIQPDLTLADLTPAESAMLILPGGDAWDAGGNGEAVEKASAFLAAGVPVAAICGATAGLARGGVLNARPHTSNAQFYLQMTGYQGGNLYREEPAVASDGLITAGATGALEFAYQIFKQLELYSTDVLEAWYGLFKTGDPTYFAALQAAA